MRKLFLLATTGLMAALLATSCCQCGKNNKCCANEEGTPIEAEMRPMHPQPGHGPQHGPKDMKPCCPMEGDKRDCPMMNAAPGCPLGGEITPEKKALCEKFMKFDSLSVEEQKEVLKAVKADIDQREAEMAAKKAEMEQKWANFEQLSIEEQKQLIEMKSFGGMMKMGPKRPMGDHHGAPHHGEGRHHAPHHNK